MIHFLLPALVSYSKFLPHYSGSCFCRILFLDEVEIVLKWFALNCDYELNLT